MQRIKKSLPTRGVPVLANGYDALMSVHAGAHSVYALKNKILTNTSEAHGVPALANGAQRWRVTNVP